MARRVAIVSALALLVAAAATTAFAADTFYYHDCSCAGPMSAPCATLDNQNSGSCLNAGPFVTSIITSQKITCETELRTCATLMLHADSYCQDFTGILMPVCNTCQRLGDPSLAKNGVLSKYAYIACDAATQGVTATTECNSDCSVCTGGNHTHNFEMCSNSAAHVDTYMVNQGLHACPAVRVQQWQGSPSCADAPAVDRLVSQNYCSGEGLIRCANQPTLTVPKGDNVLMTTCAEGCSVGCSYKTVKAGTCAPVPSPASMQLYQSATCDTEIATCANIAIWEDFNCTGRAIAYSAKCGACAKGQWGGGKPYHMINCFQNGSVTISDCDDALCTQGCSTNDPRRDLFKCVPARPISWSWGQSGPPQVPGAMNFGIVPCATVTESLYAESTCTSEPFRKIVVSEAMCAGNQRAQCGNFDLQSVTLTDCRCHFDGSQCGRQEITPSGECRQPTNISGQSVPGMSFAITCDPTPRTCARAVIFNNSNCDGAPRMIAQPVCDVCDYTPDFGYLKINCDGGRNTSISYGCDASCNNCRVANVRKTTAMSEQCMATIAGDFSFVVQAISNCDAVTITTWNTSATCGGNPASVFHRSGGQCAYGASIQCGAAPALPGPNSAYNGTGPLQVIETICTTTYCGGENACNSSVIDSGVCTLSTGRISPTAAPAGNFTATPAPATVMSRTLTCGGPQYCADEILFHGSQCERDTFLAIATSVCNACNYRNGSYYRMRCDPNSNNIWWDLGCNANCSMCSNPMVDFRPTDQCAPGLVSGYMAVNKGVYRCESIQVQEFGAPTCDGNAMIRNYAAPLGQCTFGQTLACGRFNLPVSDASAATVQQTPCNWCGSDCPPQTTFKSNTCQASADPNSFVGSAIVGCPAGSNKCARMAFFDNANCNGFQGVFPMVCGQCMSLPNGGGYGRVVCDEHNMQVTIYMGCNSDCSVCNNPTPHVSNLEECSVAEFGSWSKQLLTIVECDALIKIDYKTRDCTGNPIFAGAMPQGFCSQPLNQTLTCSNAAGLAFSGDNLEVLQTQCTNSKWCAQNCVANVRQSGNCVVQSDTNGVQSKKFSCDKTAGGMCVDFGIFSNTACSYQNQSQWFPRSIKCGTCLMDGFIGTNIKIDCDAATGDVTFTRGCDGTCGNCNANSKQTLNIKNQACSGAMGTSGSWGLSPWTISPCATITVQQFTSKDCSGPASFTNQVADGDCGPQGRLQCGTNYAATFDVNRNMDNVNFYQCNTQAPPSQHSRGTFASGSCQANLLPGFKSTRATCSTSRGYCTDLYLWRDADCTKWGEVVNVACNSCVRSGLHYFQVNCESNSMWPSVASCSDSNCANCNATVQIPLGKCSTVLGQAMQSKGVIPCRTVYVEQFLDSTNCTGNKLARSVAQSWCDLNGVFTCTKQKYQPFPSPPSDQNVLVQRCAPGTACSQECGFSTVPSGGCSTTEYGGMKPTCNAKQSFCTTMGVYRGSSCTDFVNLLSVACDQCQFLPALGYYSYVRCDVATNQVFFSTECDSQCNTCKNVNYAIRDQYVCSPGVPIKHAWVTVSDMYIVNYGVHSCDTISTEIFSSGSCAAATKIGQMEFEMGRCDSDTIYSCGDFQLQTVTREQCDCGTSCPQYTYNNNTFASGSGCLKTSNGSVSAKCDPNPVMCTNVVVFAGQDCTNYQWGGAAVCGSCFLYEGMNVRVTCDQAMQSISLYHCSDASCSPDKCTTYMGGHGVNNCSNAIIGSHSVFNLGINPCDAVQVTYYSSDNCDTSTVTSYLTRAQGECSWGDVYRCAAPPYISNQAMVQGKSQVLLSSCPAGSKNGQFCMSKDCKTSVHTDGVCFEGTGNARWPANSSRYTCAGGGMCTSMLLFQNAGTAKCSGTPNSIYTAVCGSCFPMNGEWHRVFCDTATRAVTYLTGCDSTCGSCNASSSSYRPEHQCVETIGGGGSWVINRAVFPCSTVQVQQYAGRACEASTTMFNYTMAAGHCNMGDTYHCGNFNLPATQTGMATVSEAQCFCGQSGTCPPLKTYNESTCQSTTLFGGQMTMSVTCNAQPDICVTVHGFGSPSCTAEWHGMNTLACGTCMKGGDGAHYRVDCDFDAQTATVRMNCDATCSNCGPLSYARVFNAFQCAPGLGPNNWLQVTAIAPCTTATYMAFNNQGCAGAPVFMQTVGQGQCTAEGVNLVCNNAPALPTGTGFKQVLETICPIGPEDPWVCHGTTCKTTLYESGVCAPYNYGGPVNPNWPKFYQKVTCGTKPTKCVDFVFFNNSATCEMNAFKGVNSIACDSCIFNRHVGMYIGATCNADGSVTAKNCTDPLCQQCSGTPVNAVQPETCTFDNVYAHVRPQPNTKLYMRFTQVHDCIASTFDIYQTADCSGTPMAQNTHGSGGCTSGVTLRCGNDFRPSATNPTAAPAPANAQLFTVVLKQPFASQTFATALSTTVSGATLSDLQMTVSPNGTIVSFFFIGPQARNFQFLLERSLTENSAQTAALLGASSITMRAAPTNAPTPGPGGPTGDAGGGKKSSAQTIEIVVGVLAAMGLLIVLGLVLRSRANRTDSNAGGSNFNSSSPQSGTTGVNVRPSDVEEPMYQEYRDGTF